MPKHNPNVPHSEVAVPWHVTQQIRRMPARYEEVVNDGTDGYRLIDIELNDGRTLSGVLVIEDRVIVPDEDEWRFDETDIVSVRPTPEEVRPPLRIESAEALARHGAYDMADVVRMMLFLSDGEDAEPPDVEAADPLDRWAPDLDPCDRVDDVVLTPEGWRISYVPRPGADVETAIVPRPRTAMLWDDILSAHVGAEGGATLRHVLLTLQALDARTLAYVHGYLRLWPGITLAGAIRAASTVERRAEPDPDVDEIEVGWRCTTWAPEDGGPDELYVSPDASMKGPAVGEAESSNGRWSLWGVRWASALDLPIAFHRTLVVPVVHDEIMAFLSHERRRRAEIPDVPRLPLPERDCYSVPITWADALGAILSELGEFDPDREAEADDPADSGQA